MSQIQETFLFTPIQISGCQLWLDAADTSSLVLSGSSVIQWNDKSGFQRNATQTSAGNRPTYQTNLSVQYRVANSQWLNLPQSLGNTLANSAFTLFFVAQRLASGQQLLMAGSNAGTDNMLVLFTGTNQLVYGVYGVSSITGTTSAFAVGEPYSILTFQYTGSVGSIIQNGNTLVTQSLSLGLTTYSGPQLGKTYSGVDSAYSDLNQSEILIYNNSLSISQRQQIEGYLAWKWGLQGNLPSNHPYKTYRPLAQTPFPTSISPMPLVNTNVPVFLPTQISGCAVWLDGADTTTFSFSSGTNISQWRDKSGNGTTVSQGTSINQPIYASNTTNGIGTVQFNAIARNNIVCFDTSPFNYGTTNRTSFFILRNNWISGATASSPHWFWPKTGNGSAAQSLVGWIQSVNRNTFATLAITAPTGSFFILTNRFGSSTNFEQMYLNGNIANAVTLSRTGAYISATSGYRIGGLDNADVVTSNFWFDGNIGEIVLYNTTLTVAQCQQVEGYLAWKWGLTSSLPVEHPYKTPPIAPFPVQVTAFRGSLNQWIPTQISGCQLWLDAADRTTFTLSGNSISQWRDKSGNGNNATQSTSANQPTLSSNSIALNGSQWFVTSITSAPSIESFFIVLNTTSNTSVDVFAGTQGNYREVILFNGNIYVGKFGTAPSGLNGGSISTNTNLQFNYQFSNSLLTFRVNGSQTASGAPPYTYSGTNTSYIGSSTYSPNNFNGTINEIVYYNTFLTPFQAQQVEGYLAWKWGLVGSLPANHPYKLWPPSP